MSFLKKLFGKAKNTDTAVKDIPGSELEYEGFVIRATPYAAEGQLQSCGIISKTINGEMKEYRFVRADRFSTMDDAVRMVHIKGRQIIDENGDDIFQ